MDHDPPASSRPRVRLRLSPARLRLPPGRLRPSPAALRSVALSLAGAVGAALLLLVSFPPYDLWFLAPLGVAVLALASYRRGFWAGAFLGFVTGITLMIPLLSW